MNLEEDNRFKKRIINITKIEKGMALGRAHPLPRMLKQRVTFNVHVSFEYYICISIAT